MNVTQALDEQYRQQIVESFKAAGAVAMLTPKDAGVLCNLNEKTVRRKLREIKHSRVAGRVQIPRAALIDWLVKQRELRE